MERDRRTPRSRVVAEIETTAYTLSCRSQLCDAILVLEVMRAVPGVHAERAIFRAAEALGWDTQTHDCPACRTLPIAAEMVAVEDEAP